VVRAAAALLWCTVVSSPAEAQLGRLKKAAQDAVKEKLAGTKDSAVSANAPANATKASSAGASTSYALTSEHIELVIASLEPAIAYSQRLQNAKQQQNAYAKEQDAMQRCMEQVKLSYDPMKAMSMSEKTVAEIGRLSELAGAAQTRAMAALERKDQRTYLLILDTASVLYQQSALITMGGKCNVPYVPAAVVDMQVASKEDAAQSGINPTAAAKAKLTHTQFGRMRERIALWGMLQEDPSMKVGSEGVFTADEHAALQARASDIKRMTAYFKDSTLRWSTWGDVTTW
jgi:hypothetical protein